MHHFSSDGFASPVFPCIYSWMIWCCDFLFIFFFFAVSIAFWFYNEPKWIVGTFPLKYKALIFPHVLTLAKISMWKVPAIVSSQFVALCVIHTICHVSCWQWVVCWLPTAPWSQIAHTDFPLARHFTNTTILNMTRETRDSFGVNKPNYISAVQSGQRRDQVEGQWVNSCWRMKVTRYRCSMLPGSQWCILGIPHYLSPSMCFLTSEPWPLIDFFFSLCHTRTIHALRKKTWSLSEPKI